MTDAVGARIQTTSGWAERYRLQRMTGVVLAVSARTPPGPDRSVFVRLDEPMDGHRKHWFFPTDLEPEA